MSDGMTDMRSQTIRGQECVACGAASFNNENFCYDCKRYKAELDQLKLMRAIADREVRRRRYFGDIDNLGTI